VARLLGALSALVAATVLTNPVLADQWYGGNLVRQSTEPPYRTQLDDSIFAASDCGPAVLGMALADYGIQEDTLDLRRMTHTYQGTWPVVRVGTALQYVTQVAEDFGLVSNGLYESNEPSAFHQWTVGEIADELQRGRLVIPLVRFGLLPGHENTALRWGHYILLYAVSGDGFMYQDPAVRPIDDGRSRWISGEQLDRAMTPVWPPRQAVALGSS
jgi:hypothetical protein